ncbi:Asp/Glu/hydantoin racemase [Ephemerocybe angulata]|uniref:Asp/Glu/hydantoin racemase n=1 Tax=Ephemerocybe angulata TaxID=980116 RepID=A0A8H6I468_9AGAR|nr:Asp/Glu/hydantoin racemase [Tulosesus angulatus]
MSNESRQSSSGIALLVINPNTTVAMTEGLRTALSPLTPPDATLTFYTAPAEYGAPHAITDIATGVASAHACFRDITEKKLLDQYDGFLVSCFSDHPLTHILRAHTSKPVLNILESSISHSLLLAPRFGILTTGTGFGYIYHQDVRNFLGASSDRFAGLLTVGVGPAELDGTGSIPKAEVDKRLRESAVKMKGELGADVIILGCAGMAGMEPLVRNAVTDAGLGQVRVVDGAKAGVQFLAGLARLDKASR